MICETDQFQFDHQRVISEVIEGEIVVVHFESGCYYSIRDTGADVCRLLSAGHTVPTAISQLAKHHHVSESQIGPEVKQFVARLVEEKLLATSSGETRQASPLELSDGSYSPPTFEKFDDMADQLLLDPIHEIGEAGWPVRPAA
jgi:Coenzyme PQQ synthesis protein D (PqqD)